MSIFGSLIGGALSLFGQSKARSQARADSRSQFVRLRGAAEKAGFNPLTALQATGGAGFTGFPSSAPPLASIELLTDAASGISDEITGKAAQDRAKEAMELDLAKIKLEQARGQVAAMQPQTAAMPSGFVPGAARLGRQAVTSATVAGGETRPKLGFGSTDAFDAKNQRKTEVADTVNSPGYFQIENDLTGGPLYMPGEGEPWGIDELATAVVVGAPQVAYRGMRWLGDKLYAAGAASNIPDTPEETAKKKEYARESAQVYEQYNQDKPDWLKGNY